ncbi:MAG: nitroreductase family protein [Oscillospiraceae bacterium]|nr:nitroreductase family protein [Oscillospiraceae bacterium]
MNFFEIIEKRYSHKGRFLSTPVPREKLVQIASAGLSAPTGMNLQCVKLVILPDRQAVQPLCDIAPTEGTLTAPAAIVVFTDKTTQNWKMDFQIEDYSAATENMLLAATALGYVALWLDSPYFPADKQKALCDLLNAPANYQLRTVIPIGLPDGECLKREKMPFDERVWFGEFS